MRNNIDKVQTMIRSFLGRSSGRYLVIGGSVYALELLIIFIGQRAGLSAVWAVSLGFWVGLVVSFLLQKFVTFGDKRTHHRVLLPQIIAMGLLVLFNYGFTVLATKLLIGFMPAVVIRTLALAITTIWNYYLYKTHIFNWGKGAVY